LIGTNSAYTSFFNNDVTPQFQVVGGGSGASSVAVVRTSNNGDGPSYLFGRMRSTSHGIVQNGDRIGRLTYQAADGVVLQQSASIDAYVDGAPGVNDTPARIVFSTTASGTNTYTERMRINNAGTVIINPNLTGGYTPLIVKGERSSSTTLLSLETDDTGQDDDTIQLDFKMNSGADTTERVAGRIAVQNVTTGAARGRMIFSVLEDAGNLIEAMRIDDDGEVLIGSTTTGGSITPMNLKLTTEGDSGNNLVIGKHVAGAYAPAIAFAASEGTEASPTVVAEDDPLGQINFYGYDGDSYGLGAYIRASVDGTPSTSTDMPTRVSIFTAPDGTESPVERMRISQDGDVDIGQTGGGVKLAVAGAVGTQNGTAAAPTHTFYSDADTGMYRVSTDTLAFSTGGSRRLNLNSAGGVAIGTGTGNVINSGFTETSKTFAVNTTNASSYTGAKQTFNGLITAGLSGVWKDIAKVNATNALSIYVIALTSDSPSTGSAALTANLVTPYGGGIISNKATNDSGSITAIDVQYLNSAGTSGQVYVLQVKLTYSGVAPNVRYTVEGMSTGQLYDPN
jgi:hypothetical protein